MLLNGYVIMPNHLHFLAYVYRDTNINKALGEGKRFLAYEVVRRLKQTGNDQLLVRLSEDVSGHERCKGKKHQVFRLSFDAKECKGKEEIERVLDYMHRNPVSGKWNLVSDFVEYPYSSARFYEMEEPGDVMISDYRSVYSESLSGDSEKG